MPMPDYEHVIAHITPAFSDDRGDISNILSGAPIKHIAIITSVKGSIRGNHKHPAPQYIYMLEGRMLSWSGEGLNTHQETAEAGDLLYCPPNTPHAYYFLEATIFLNLDGEPRGDYANDTTPVVVMKRGENGEPVRQ